MDTPESNDSGTDVSETSVFAEGDEITNVILQIGAQQFKVRLFPLLKESVFVMRCVDEMFTSSRVIRVINVPLSRQVFSEDIFNIVMKFCYHKMDDSEITSANVVRLIITSEILIMDNLKSRALKFLTDVAFKTWESCLIVLSTFDSDYLPTEDGVSHDQKLVSPKEDSIDFEKTLLYATFQLFERCKKTFIAKLESCTISSNSRPVCDWMRFIRVAILLAVDIAKLIYESMVAEQFGLFYTNGNTDTQLNLFTREFCSRPWAALHYYSREAKIEGLSEDMRTLLVDSSKRSLVVMYLAKLIRGTIHRKEGGTEFREEDALGSSSLVCMEFFCLLLVEAIELVTNSENSALEKGLQEELKYLLEIASHSFASVSCFPNEQKMILLLAKFHFSSLLFVVEALLWSHTATKMFDMCIVSHLTEKSLTMHQVLIIYEKFPNHDRSSHDEIYLVFANFLKKQLLSPQQLNVLDNIFDYTKVSDFIVERIWVQFGYCKKDPPGLQQRIASMIKAKARVESERDKFHRKLAGARAGGRALATELNEVKEVRRRVGKELETARKKLETVDEELEQLTNIIEHEKNVGEQVRKELEEMKSDKRKVEEELKLVRTDVDNEKDKNLCRICFVRPRDSLLLPCLHLHFCSQCLQLHLRRSKTCPTCRGFANTTLKCIL